MSNIIITKPGGISTSECIAMKKPMVIINPIPGQEERNVDYLIERGIITKAYDEDSLRYREVLLRQSVLISEVLSRRVLLSEGGIQQPVFLRRVTIRELMPEVVIPVPLIIIRLSHGGPGRKWTGCGPIHMLCLISGMLTLSLLLIRVSWGFKTKDPVI